MTTDIRRRLARANQVNTPDLWRDIEALSVRTSPDSRLDRVEQSRPGSRIVAGVVALMVFGSAVVFAWSAFKPSPHETDEVSPAETTFEPCVNGWETAQLPEPPGAIDVSISAISGTSQDDIWAVGQYVWAPPGYSPEPLSLGPSQTTAYPLVEHWDGDGWSIVPTADIPESGPMRGAGFVDVAAIAPDDVWAVGSGPTPSGDLIEHWDGETWSLVHIPNETENDILRAVGGSGPDDVWAVGNANETTTLIKHWDGNSWSVVPTPNVGNRENQLWNVAALTSNDAWAVGAAWDRTLVLHWDGRVWSVVPSPNDDRPRTMLYGVDARSPDDAWAVGASWPDINGNRPTNGVIMHWNGNDWAITHSTAPDLPDWSFNEVSVSPSGDAWAVGWAGTQGPNGMLLMHWDGQTWATLNVPPHGIIGGGGALAFIDGAVVAGGTYFDGQANDLFVTRGC